MTANSHENDGAQLQDASGSFFYSSLAQSQGTAFDFTFPPGPADLTAMADGQVFNFDLPCTTGIPFDPLSFGAIGEDGKMTMASSGMTGSQDSQGWSQHDDKQPPATPPFLSSPFRTSALMPLVTPQMPTNRGCHSKNSSSMSSWSACSIEPSLSTGSTASDIASPLGFQLARLPREQSPLRHHHPQKALSSGQLGLAFNSGTVSANTTPGSSLSEMNAMHLDQTGTSLQQRARAHTTASAQPSIPDTRAAALAAHRRIGSSNIIDGQQQRAMPSVLAHTTPTRAVSAPSRPGQTVYASVTPGNTPSAASAISHKPSFTDGDSDEDFSESEHASNLGRPDMAGFGDSTFIERKNEIRRNRIEAEQRRRNDLRNGFKMLKECLGARASGSRVSKTGLLSRAILHIRSVETKNDELQRKCQLLNDENLKLRQANAYLSGEAARPLADVSNLENRHIQYQQQRAA